MCTMGLSTSSIGHRFAGADKSLQVPSAIGDGLDSEGTGQWG